MFSLDIRVYMLRSDIGPKLVVCLGPFVRSECLSLCGKSSLHVSRLSCLDVSK